MGSLEAAGLGEEENAEGVSGPKQVHVREEIILMQRKAYTQYQSHLTTMSVQTRHCSTQRDLQVPENYRAPHSQTTLPEACSGDCSGL